LPSSSTEPEDGMDSLASYLIGEHISDLRREADAARLARLAVTERTRASATERTRSAWRRQVGGGARRLSRALGNVAAQLDPPRRSYGRE
jgi:hypothetical protein